MGIGTDMFDSSNDYPASTARDSAVSGEIFLPLGEAVLIDVDHDLLHWKMASDTIMRRARQYNAALKARIATLRHT